MTDKTKSKNFGTWGVLCIIMMFIVLIATMYMVAGTDISDDEQGNILIGAVIAIVVLLVAGIVLINKSLPGGEKK